jgi:hypothetical protein
VVAGLDYIMSEDSDLAHRKPGYVEITCSEPSLFRLWSARDLAQSVDLLQAAAIRHRAGTMTNASFLSAQQVIGLNCNPLGLIADIELRDHINPIECCTYDWLHNMLQDGTFTLEASSFIVACEHAGLTTWKSVQTFLQDAAWSYPVAARTKCRQLHRVFDEIRTPRGEDHRLRCSASELLGLYGLLRHFVETEIGEHAAVALKRASFDAACESLDMILLAKAGVLDVVATCDPLRAVMAKHLRLHQAAYGTEHIKPKHHWNLDMAEQLKRDKCILDAFIIERIHLQVKRIAEHVKHTHAFERSVLAGVLNVALRVSHDCESTDGLRKPIMPLPGMEGAFIADHVRVFGMQVSIGDVVFYGGVSGKVVACIAEGGDLFVLVDTMHRIAERSPHSANWALSGNREAWFASHLEPALAWHDEPDTTVLVVRR